MVRGRGEQGEQESSAGEGGAHGEGVMLINSFENREIIVASNACRRRGEGEGEES